jgi:DUF438 domain-containing protein
MAPSEIKCSDISALHHEHVAVSAFLKRLNPTAQARGRSPPGSSQFTRLLGDLIAVVETELAPHFKFEETKLFPLMIDAGADDMCKLLQEDHDVILPLASRLCDQARSIRHEGHSVNGWNQFRRDGLELAERLSAHIEKEEMGLVPMLDEMLNEEQDMRLIDGYALMR